MFIVCWTTRRRTRQGTTEFAEYWKKFAFRAEAQIHFDNLDDPEDIPKRVIAEVLDCKEGIVSK